MELTTNRLLLVPATLAMHEAELLSPAALAKMLKARVPEGWPPGEYDRQAIEYFCTRLREHPGDAGWLSWYAFLRSEDRVLVGAAGFFGPPDEEHVAEIGYSIVGEYQRQGFATEIVRGLAVHAKATGMVTRLIAHTVPANIASVRVLERAGFRPAVSAEEGKLKYEKIV